jgi:hypothetical protein
MNEGMDERKPWEQIEGESMTWFRRFDRYRLMVFGRSVAAVFQEEYSKKLDNTRKSMEPDGTWYKIAEKWQWEARAAQWDAFQAEEAEKIIAREREIVFRSGFALVHKRVQSLDRILNKLIDMTEDQDKVWIPDVKAIGNGPGAERVDLVNFNAPLFALIDKYKASIAAEMGERVKKKDITVTELPPNVYLFDPDSDGSVTQENEGEEDEQQS